MKQGEKKQFKDANTKRNARKEPIWKINAVMPSCHAILKSLLETKRRRH